jgi:hypothetical protein
LKRKVIRNYLRETQGKRKGGESTPENAARQSVDQIDM